ncbi:MAG: DUF2884 family protein [Algibacter sp.]
MNKSIILKVKLLALSLFITTGLVAQEKLTKVSQSIKVDKDVTIDLNTSHCNIIFDTWNKGEVQIEAFVEGDGVSQEALQDAIKDWGVDIDGSEDHVSIKTTGSHAKTWVYKTDDDEDVVAIVLNELMHELADLPVVIMEDFDVNFEAPEPSEMPELPELPEGIGNMHFDYDAYQKDGEKYIEKYTKKFESKFGKDFEKKMEAWGESFGEKMEAWGEKFEKNFNTEEFEEKMEAWGERFAEQMERQADKVEAKAERIEAIQERVEAKRERVEVNKERAEQARERGEHAKERAKLEAKRRVKIEQYMGGKSDSKIKKTIIIKMPKDAKLKINVRHGELKLASNVDNLEADLSHTKFIAHSISGSFTSINASYSPVTVTHWNLGELNLNYVERAELTNVKRLVLNSNASNVEIQNLTDNAMVNGSIGKLKIINIDNTFNNLSVILQNSDAVISLPKVDYNLQYSGNRTRFSHPENTKDDSASSFSKHASNTNKTIVVNAKYSHVVMK